MIAIGSYFMISGVAMALSNIGVRIVGPSVANIVVKGGALAFAAWTFAVLLLGAISMELTVQVFMEKIAPGMFLFFI